MLQFVWDNMEWIFSCIGALGVLVAFIKWLRRSKAVPLESQPQSPEEGTRRSSLESLTPAQITTNIRQIPLLQRQDASRYYHGIRVSWVGRLTEARMKASNRASMYLLAGVPGVVVLFEVDPSEYPGIRLLREGHKLQVEGEISQVTPDSIMLRNVRLKL